MVRGRGRIRLWVPPRSATIGNDLHLNSGGGAGRAGKGGAEQGKGSPGQAMPGEELGWGRWRGAADAQSGGLWDGGSA